MLTKHCRLCGSFLWKKEEQLEDVEIPSVFPIEYKWFLVFIFGMIIGAIISQLGG